MLLWERLRCLCPVTLVRKHAVGLLLDGKNHVSWALTEKKLPLSPLHQLKVERILHAMHDVSVCVKEKARKGKKRKSDLLYVYFYTVKKREKVIACMLQLCLKEIRLHNKNKQHPYFIHNKM